MPTLAEMRAAAEGGTLDELSFIERLGTYSGTDASGTELMRPRDKRAHTIRCLEGYLHYVEQRADWPTEVDVEACKGFARERLRILKMAAVAVLVLTTWATPVRGQATPLKRTLQAATTTISVGTPAVTEGYRYKTLAYEISGSGTVRAECSLDGNSFDVVLDTTYSEIDACGPPPNRCLIDLPISCSVIRAPVTACTGCTISVKLYAEP